MASDASGLWAARGVTARELEVLGYVGRRFGNAEIADVLSLSKRTVESHVSSLYRKLDVISRSELVREASRAGGPSRLLHVDGESDSTELHLGGLPRPVAASRQARATAAQLRVRATVHRRSASSRVRAARRIVAESWALKDAGAHRIVDRPT